MDEKEVIVCNGCKKPIEEIAYIHILPSIVMQKFFTANPPLFKCKEHLENYSKTLDFHDTCWMKELKSHGVEINNMTEIAKKYAKQKLEELEKGDTDGLGQNAS